MKVLVVQNIEGIAGSEKYFLSILPELKDRGVECEFISVCKKSFWKVGEDFNAKLNKKGIPAHLIMASGYLDPRIPFKINKIFKKGRFDLLHSHLIYADFWLSLVKLFRGKSVTAISTKHGYREDEYVEYCLKPKNLPKGLYFYIFRFSEKLLDRSYACSYGLRQFYLEAGLIDRKEEMDVIQHGFNYPEIKSPNKGHLKKGHPQLVIVGRLIQRKGHHFVFKILPDLIQKYPNLHLSIVGSGEAEESLKDQVTALGLNDSVSFEGFQTNIMDYMAEATATIVPSYAEGLPLVIFEAFNARSPVVAFDTIGPGELIENEVTGIKVKAFDPEDLREGIIRLIENESLRNKITENAFRELKQHFSIERMTNETIDFFKKVLSR